MRSRCCGSSSPWTTRSKPTKQEEKEFILGNKAADLWLTICDACANEKVIPKKYRYTTGTGLMNTAESICGDIEEANLTPRARSSRATSGTSSRASTTTASRRRWQSASKTGASWS